CVDYCSPTRLFFMLALPCRRRSFSHLCVRCPSVFLCCSTLTGDCPIFRFFLTISLFYGGFFFSSRRRHTISKRDWSSDVCSSDLYLFSDNVFFIFSFASVTFML